MYSKTMSQLFLTADGGQYPNHPSEARTLGLDGAAWIVWQLREQVLVIRYLGVFVLVRIGEWGMHYRYYLGRRVNPSPLT